MNATDETSSGSGSDTDPQGELDRVLAEGEDKGKKVAAIGRNLTEAGQSMADMANATRQVVHVVKAPPNIESLIGDWQLTNEHADMVLGQLGNVDVRAFISVSGTSASTSSDAFDDRRLFSVVPEEEHPRLATVLKDFREVSARAVDEEQVVSLMNSLQLDEAPPGRKSPLEQFKTAHAAFKAPVATSNPIITSLIPMRESIRAVIDNLLRRRPKQEKTKNQWAKIVSIGKQLKRDSLPDAIVNSWASQWTYALQTSLSPSKEQDISRDEWRRRLTSSTLFLNGFLSGIDPLKFKT